MFTLTLPLPLRGDRTPRRSPASAPRRSARRAAGGAAGSARPTPAALLAGDRGRRRPRSPDRRRARILLIVEDDVRFADDPARPGARAGLPVRGRRTPRADGLARRRELSAERDPARHQPARPLRPGRARPAQAQPAHAPHPGARRLGRPTTRSRRSSCGAVGYALKPVKREQLVAALRSGSRRKLHAGPAPRAGGRGRRAPAREHPAAAERRRRGDHRRRHRRRGAAAAGSRPPSTAW